MKIYISCTRSDREYADKIINNVQELRPEWKLFAYHTEEKIGDDYREVLSKNLRDADAIILFISREYNKSRYGCMELDWALGYYYEHHSPVLIPVILDDASVPYDLQQFLYFKVNTRINGYNGIDDIGAVCNKLVETLLRIEIQKKENNVVGFAKRVNKNGSEYIKETKQRLEKQVRQNKRLAYVCYIGCFILLCICTILCYQYSRLHIIIDQSVSGTVQSAISNIAVISLLVATARFAFVLGKSFMVEAIRNMDRIHAIDFGDFYLKLFKEDFEWPELKEILQNWNIDKGSAFITQEAKDIDPQILELLSEILKRNIKK